MLGQFFTYRIEGKIPGYASANFYDEEITPPTGSAGASSWADWGYPVPYSDAREGDIVVLLRLGGHHVCFLAEESLDISKATFQALGGNQGNQVCIAAEKTSNILAVRRGENF